MNKIKNIFALLFISMTLSGCLWDAAKMAYSTGKFAYNVTSGTISTTYDIVSGGISLAKSFYNHIDKWADKQVPSQKIYVKYTHDYENRAIIDYEKGTIVIETIDEVDPYQSLEDAIVTTLLTPDDPRMVDLFSSDEVNYGNKTPFLLGQVVDKNGNVIRTEYQAKAFASELLATSAKSYDVNFGGENQSVFGVSLNLVVGHSYLRAQKFLPYVTEYSRQYNVSKSLIMGVMETESAFNPFAISSSGAIGLMQIMKASAGTEVYKYLHGVTKAPSDDMLFQPKVNIQYGTIYLHILATRFLGDVRNPTSREYCVIAAYNTGPGNLLRTFDSNKDRAIAEINSMHPEELFEYLEDNLPHDETRRYIVKVRNNKRKYN